VSSNEAKGYEHVAAALVLFSDPNSPAAVISALGHPQDQDVLRKHTYALP
jgi:hypothetical protein